MGSTWTPVAETWYIYDGMTVIQERSNTNVPTVHYTRGLDLSGTLGGAGGISGLLTRSSGYNASTGAWSTHDYEHADGSGNITMLISNSSTPTIRAQYEYDPFGRIQTQSGTLATANTQRFSSKEQIGTSPLSYYGYRFYHAEAQRWINRDPIEESGGLNLYGFVRNMPLYFLDAYGLSIWVDILPFWGTISTCNYIPRTFTPLLDCMECRSNEEIAEYNCTKKIYSELSTELSLLSVDNAIGFGTGVIGAAVGIISPTPPGIVIAGVLAIDSYWNLKCDAENMTEVKKNAHWALEMCTCQGI